MPSGIAKIAPRDNNLQAEDNLVLIPANESLSFGVSLYGETKNIKAVTKEIKWIWVDAEYLDQLRTMVKETKFEHWGKWSAKNKIPIRVYGIGVNYAKSTAVNISNVSKQKHLVGKKYWLEAFVHYPEFKHPVGKYFVVKGTPSILNAYFEGAAIGNDYNLIKSKYGQTVNLLLDTHLLPDVSVNYHNYVVFEVDIYNHEKNKKVTKDPIRSVVDFAKETKDLNSKIKIAIIIEDTWRSDAGHNNSEEVRNYYALIKATHYFNKDAVYNGKAKSSGLFGNAEGASFRQQSPNGELVAYTITKEDWEKNHWMEHIFGRSLSDVKKSAAKYQSTEITFKTIDSKGEQLPVYIEVPYTTQSEAIEARNIEAGKMLAEVKDQKYTCKNYDPCKFTGIEVLVGKNKPTVIFNEEELSNQEITDNTTKVFSFVAGDSKKETVKITLKDLSITDYGNDSGEIKCIAPEPHTTKNLIDATKVSPQWLVEKGTVSDKKYSTYEIKENTILLEMGYIYNTDYDNRAKEWLNNNLGQGVNDLADIAWMVRYFYMNDHLAKSYNIPVGTCRYPSQIVRLKIYPDFKWEIKVKFSSKKKTFTRESHIGKDGTEKVSKKSRKVYKFGEKEYQLSIETKVWINDTLTKITLKKPPLENEIRLLLWFIHVVKKVTFTKDFSVPVLKNPERTFDRRQKEREKAHKKVGTTITVGVPSLMMVLEGAFKTSANYPSRVGSEYRIGGAISWSINGQLDLLYFAKFMGPVGVAVDRVSDLVKNLNKLTGGRLSIAYGLYLYASADLELRPSLRQHSIDGTDGNVKLKAEVKIGLKIDASARAALRDVEFYVEGDIGAEARVKATITYNSDTDIPICKGEFLGIFAQGSFKLGKMNKKGAKSEFNLSLAHTIIGPETFEIGN